MKRLLLCFLFLVLLGCQAEVEGTPESQPPQDGCFCGALYDPVCGSDGATHSNECRARCAGITEVVRGECS